MSIWHIDSSNMFLEQILDSWFDLFVGLWHIDLFQMHC